jgi:N6-adenosine-specific RNA methylase IME4
MAAALQPTSNKGLVLYEAACRALAKARTVDEVKKIRDKSMRWRLCAQQANNKTLEADALEIRLRAERRLGEMLIEDHDLLSKGGRPRKTSSIEEPVSVTLMTLGEIGIDKKLSMRAQQFAALPEAQFDQIIIEGREKITEESGRVAKRVINILSRKATKLAEPGLIEGRNRCIVIDPPWPMEKIEREVRPNQVGFEYPTMSEDELADFDLPGFAAKNCHLFCWTTQRFLPMALRLLDQWDFRYVCEFVWHKPGGFQPVGLPQYNCEFALYARLGSPKFRSTKSFATCFEAPRREHSRKPDEFYNMVRRVTAGPRIDIFSREKRDGFKQYGYEHAKFSLEAAE